MAEERQVTIPLMVMKAPGDDLRFVEEDLDTVSDTEMSTGIGRASLSMVEGHVYSEISSGREESKLDYLDIPKFGFSRSSSDDSSRATSPTLKRSSSTRSHHDYEKLSVTSNASKKSAVERIAEGTFFRRRTAETALDRRHENRSDDEEHVLEALRQVVRKCTNTDPLKRPNSKDLMNLLVPQSDKS